MTTLPPEGQNGAEAGAPGQPEPQPEPFEPPQVPQAPVPPVPPVQVPPQQQYQAQPQAQPQPQPQPQPQQQYQAPPQQPGYQAPPGGFQQPGGYQQPGYQQPAGGYQQAPATDPVSTITLNYWLSVFFTWIPALIFYLLEKDKGNQQATEFHRENLNFSLLRTGLYVAIVIASFIPYLGIVLVPILWIAQLVGFIFHIIAAVKAPEAYRTGQRPGFILNVPFVR